MDAGFDDAAINRYLLHALEAERGAVEVYATSLSTTPSPAWRREITRFLDDARKHEQWMTGVCGQLGMDPDEPVVGRHLIASQTLSMIEAIRQAATSDATLAPLVACECIVLAETRNQLAWAPFDRIAADGGHECVRILSRFATDVRREHAHHLERAIERTRRLWRRRLGLDAPGRSHIVEIPHAAPAANTDAHPVADIAATAA